MVADQVWRAPPGRAVVPEVADQLPLLRIDAHDRQTASCEPHALLGDVFELLVTVRAPTSRDPLVVDAERVVEILEDPGHGPGTYVDVEGHAKLKKNPDRKYFFAVGAGHYWGDTGIQKLLKDKGLSVSSIE